MIVDFEHVLHQRGIQLYRLPAGPSPFVEFGKEPGVLYVIVGEKGAPPPDPKDLEEVKFRLNAISTKKDLILVTKHPVHMKWLPTRSIPIMIDCQGSFEHTKPLTAYCILAYAEIDGKHSNEFSFLLK